MGFGGCISNVDILVRAGSDMVKFKEVVKWGLGCALKKCASSLA